MPAHPWDAGRKARALVARHELEDCGALRGARAGNCESATARPIRSVQPSHFEAFGLSAIEAMASGVPVLASNVGGLRDFLADNDNALLLRAADAALDCGRAPRVRFRTTSLRSRPLAGKADSRRSSAEFDERVLMD